MSANSQSLFGFPIFMPQLRIYLGQILFHHLIAIHPLLSLSVASKTNVSLAETFYGSGFSTTFVQRAVNQKYLIDTYKILGAEMLHADILYSLQLYMYFFIRHLV